MKSSQLQKSHPQTSPPKESYFKVFLVGLSGGVQEWEMKKFFKSKYPSVFKVKLPKTKGKGSGCGVMMLRDPEEYKEILEKHLFYFKSRRFYVNPFLKHEELDAYLERITNRRVFISLIPKKMKDSELKHLMNQFGRVDDAYKIEQNKCGKKKFRIGFVLFRNQEDAQFAINSKRIYYENGKFLLLKPFIKKEKSSIERHEEEEGTGNGRNDNRDLNLGNDFGGDSRNRRDIPENQHRPRADKRSFLQLQSPKEWFQVNQKDLIYESKLKKLSLIMLIESKKKNNNYFGEYINNNLRINKGKSFRENAKVKNQKNVYSHNKPLFSHHLGNDQSFLPYF